MLINPLETEDTLLSTKLPRKFHNAGVTAILPLQPGLILTGSYDDHIRLIRIQPRPSILTEFNLGGGVWRLKLLATQDNNTYDILASCMHAGTRILKLNIGGCEGPTFTILATFEENESMNYGSDLQPTPTPTEITDGNGKKEDGEPNVTVDGSDFPQLQKVATKRIDDGNKKFTPKEYTVVSTSFYDKRLCLWKFRDTNAG